MVLRILRYPLSLLLIEAVAVILVASLVSLGAHMLQLGQGPAKALGGLVLALAIIAVWKGLQRWLERRTDAEFAAAGALPELGGGVVFGVALFSAMAGLVALLGGLSIVGVRGISSIGALWTMLAMAITSGVVEETLFRGILFRHVEALLGTWAALGVTAAFFGAAHLFNPGASWFSAFAIATEAGILLGAAYLLTRRLWLAVGIHAGWNFSQGWVFSVPVSGGKTADGLLITMRSGPDWLTGGAFGLEASVVAVAVATAAGFGLLTLALRRQGITVPRWRTQKTVSF